MRCQPGRQRIGATDQTASHQPTGEQPPFPGQPLRASGDHTEPMGGDKARQKNKADFEPEVLSRFKAHPKQRIKPVFNYHEREHKNHWTRRKAQQPSIEPVAVQN